MIYDTVIIGAGMSGLAAGIRLAQYDQRVCILEKHSLVGGMNSFYVQNGRQFDVGLHAITNYASKGTKSGPLSRVLRHLRLSWDEFGLCEQLGSTIAFPDVSLQFSNKFDLLEAEIHAKFPSEIEGFRRMVAGLIQYDQLGLGQSNGSARAYVSEFLHDPLLIEMLFCPLFYYGGARENDMEFGQFCIMFRSIFLEGFARPYEGVRHILLNLVKKYKNLGGELRLNAKVSQIVSRDGKIEKVLLENGEEIYGKKFLSSAGWPETMNLCQLPQAVPPQALGKLAFVETICVLDSEPKRLGHRKTIVFFNDSPTFHYENPSQPVDLRSGVICSPNNFHYSKPLKEGILRITALANFHAWKNFDARQYRVEKCKWFDRILGSASRFIPDFRSNIIETDMFTPTTVQRFTNRLQGAIYGTGIKKYDGQTPYANLFLCGTDQGMVGIIGTLVSGISIANKYILS